MYENRKSEISGKNFFDKIGWHNFDGKHYYCAGNRIIPEIDDFRITEGLESLQFEIDSQLNDGEALEKSLKIMNIAYEISSVLYISGFVGICRQLFYDAGVKISAPIFLFGDSQTGKTTLAELATRMFNRSKLTVERSQFYTRVSSTSYKVEQLISNCKDNTFILDDLHKAGNDSKLNQNEWVVCNAIRNLADNTARQTKQSAFECLCQLVITSEYLLHNKSDIGRCFVIRADKNLINHSLTECQNEPLVLSTHYFYFIKWLADNYNSIVEEITEAFKKFRAKANEDCKFKRVYDYAFVLKTVFKIYCRYISSINVDIEIKNMRRRFKNNIRKLIKEQEDILDYLVRTEDVPKSLAVLLVDAIVNKKIIVGEKGEGCYREGNDLFIRAEYFGSFLYDEYRMKVGVTTITRYFSSRYISETYRDGRQKKRNNIYYIHIKLDRLYAEAESKDAMIDEWFFRKK